ncbi:MAG TPA: hypothetical protein VL175_05670 [Pirellulales bacterium]|nr:hypothetical protein [Pirellulales bacterium]
MVETRDRGQPRQIAGELIQSWLPGASYMPAENGRGGLISRPKKLAF